MWKESCSKKYEFLCESSNILKGNNSLKIEYKKSQLRFSTFTMWYHYIVPNQQFLNSSDNRKMSGFRLRWSIQAQNGTSLTELKPDRDEAWRPMSGSPRFPNANLRRMVALAQQARLGGWAGEEAVSQAILSKHHMVTTGAIDYSQCSQGQVKVTGEEPFDGIVFPGTAEEEDITDVDIKIGFALYSVTVMCVDVERLQLGQFLESLVLTENPRTLHQATVNTVHLERMEKPNRKLMSQFYEALSSKLNLQQGRILLALSSPTELEAMLARDLPYLTPYTQQITDCVRGGTCQGVTDLVEHLGIKQ
jgi:hypothetical protein